MARVYLFTNLQLPRNLWVSVNCCSHVVDQLDNQFGHIVARSSFPTNHDCARANIRVRIVPYHIVQSDYVKAIQQLPFILVYSFYLHGQNRNVV